MASVLSIHPWAWLKAIWRLSAKWMVHLWLGIPLCGGIAGLSVAKSQYADVYDVAIKAPSFWREGVITRPDLRGRRLRLTMANGDRREIRCFMGDTAGSSCLFGRDFPIKARVELFDYKGAWMIFSVREIATNIILVEKNSQIYKLKIGSAYDATLTPEFEFWRGVGLGAFITPPFIIVTFLKRRRDRILAQGRATNAE
jgi:hypothetical protein